jgi:hypothetical protein
MLNSKSRKIQCWMRILLRRRKILYFKKVNEKLKFSTLMNKSAEQSETKKFTSNCISKYKCNHLIHSRNSSDAFKNWPHWSFHHSLDSIMMKTTEISLQWIKYLFCLTYILLIFDYLCQYFQWFQYFLISENISRCIWFD